MNKIVCRSFLSLLLPFLSKPLISIYFLLYQIFKKIINKNNVFIQILKKKGKKSNLSSSFATTNTHCSLLFLLLLPLLLLMMSSSSGDAKSTSSSSRGSSGARSSSWSSGFSSSSGSKSSSSSNSATGTRSSSSSSGSSSSSSSSYYYDGTYSENSGFGYLQSVGANAKLVCNDIPAGNVLVKLYDEDPIWDDLIDYIWTDGGGMLTIYGSTREYTLIEPKLNIYHDCNDTDICQRKFSIPIPDEYITYGSHPNRLYELGTIELAWKRNNETRDCLH